MHMISAWYHQQAATESSIWPILFLLLLRKTLGFFTLNPINGQYITLVSQTCAQWYHLPLLYINRVLVSSDSLKVFKLFFADSTAFLSFWEHFLSTDVQNFSTPITFLLFWAYCVSISPCMKWPRCVQDEKQRPEKSQLSSWQTFTRKKFPDEVRKLFSRHVCQKRVNCFSDMW